jgi:hypothetical protein
MTSSWLHALSGLISAAGGSVPGAHCEIRVRCGEVTGGIDLATGSLSTGVNASSEVRGDEAALMALVRGEVTLQAAFREGTINLTGEPEPFLRLAMILDTARQTEAVTC